MQIWRTTNPTHLLIEQFKSNCNIWDVKWISENQLAFGNETGTIEVNEIGAKKPISVIEAHNVNIEPSISLEQSLKLSTIFDSLICSNKGSRTFSCVEQLFEAFGFLFR